MGGRLTEHLETELKFEVSLEFVVPELSGLADGVTVTEPQVRLLEARYFDTRDLRLAAAGITLRRRTGGTDAGWHLKLPVGAGTRRELRAPLGEAATAVPPELRALVTSWIEDHPLQVVAVGLGLFELFPEAENLLTLAVAVELLLDGFMVAIDGLSAEAVLLGEARDVAVTSEEDSGGAGDADAKG